MIGVGARNLAALHAGSPAAPRPQDRMLALGRLKAGQMNQTEGAYADHLDLLRRAGEITWFCFEGVTLKLADGCRFTPDFAVQLPDETVEIHEVKGFWRDDAKIKLKVAVEMYPIFRFVVVKRVRGAWVEERF